MKNLNFNEQEQRILWKQMWKSILQKHVWHWSFLNIPEIKNWKKEDDLISHWGVDLNGNFFNSGKYSWPSSLHNAKLVIQEAKNHTTLYELLKNNIFNTDLNLHKSISSLCEQNSDLIEDNISEDSIQKSNFFNSNLTKEQYFTSLTISNWSYGTVLISAICYVLENIYINYTQSVNNFSDPNQILAEYNQPNYLELLKKDVSININILLREIAIYLLHENYAEQLFSVLQNTRIFRIEKFATISAFSAIFTDLSNKTYRYYLKNINVKNICRFFEVFQLNFLFCNLFLENEIQSSINESDQYIHYTTNLVEIFHIYKSFFVVNSDFENFELEIPNFDQTQASISDQKFFVQTFFNHSLGTVSEINWAIQAFQIMFPSIQIDILQYLQKVKKNVELKKLV